jgi:hypothetical protein
MRRLLRSANVLIADYFQLAPGVPLYDTYTQTLQFCSVSSLNLALSAQ